MLTLLAAASLAAPQPGMLKTFGDWTVGCDNGLACRAVALVPEAVDRDSYLLMVLRHAGRGAPTRLSFPFPEEADAGGSHTLNVDGRVIARVAPRGRTSGAAGYAELAINPHNLAILRNGRRAALSGAPVSASLKGLAATLFYMEEQQRRAVPALPLIVRPTTPRKPAKTISTARARQLLGKELTVCDYAQDGPKIEAARLDARTSLALVSHPCGNGAYNIFSTTYLIDESGRTRIAVFDAATGMADDGETTGVVVNADWDPETRRLSTFFKGRGLGDCGSGQSYVWDGARFRLAHQEAMGECRGSTDYITTWRARMTGR